MDALCGVVAGYPAILEEDQKICWINRRFSAFDAQRDFSGSNLKRDVRFRRSHLPQNILRFFHKGILQDRSRFGSGPR